MIKVDNTVKRETLYIVSWIISLSVIMELICAVCGIWKKELLFGNLLGAAAAAGNFFLMGLTVQKAVTEDEKRAKKRVQTSMAARSLMMIVFAVTAAAVPTFNLIAFLIPLFFPRIAIAARPLFSKGEKNENKKQN